MLLSHFFARKGQPPSKQFEPFNKLPPELRLMIWEEAIPRTKDTHAAYKIFWSQTQEGLRREKPKNTEGPLGLLQGCPESCAAASGTGSFIRVRNEPVKGFFWKIWAFLTGYREFDEIWVEKTVKMLLVPFSALMCARITNLPSSIQAVASKMPTEKGLLTLQKCLIQDPEYKGIKMVYVRLIGIPLAYSKGDDPDYYPCTGSNPAVVPLGEEKLVTYLTTAYRAHSFQTLGDPVDHGEEFYRKSALRFKHSLKKDWKAYRSMRSLWTSDHGIKLKPAVIFGMKDRYIATDRSGDLSLLFLRLSLGHIEAHTGLVWMGTFTHDHGIGNEDSMVENSHQMFVRMDYHMIKNIIRDLQFSPHDIEGAKRYNVDL
ncbi:hypothetical protein IL306_013024 [Fusarium sp. DS 682]|nr:hypothetical protein IL306_013024 [Fusarium sp. DS 682]